MEKLLSMDHDQLLQPLKFTSSASFSLDVVRPGDNALRNPHLTETFPYQVFHTDVDPFVYLGLKLTLTKHITKSLIFTFPKLDFASKPHIHSLHISSQGPWNFYYIH